MYIWCGVDKREPTEVQRGACRGSGTAPVKATCCLFSKGTIPLEAIKILLMLITEGGIGKEGGCKFIKDLMDNHLIGGAEVSAERLATCEEQLIRNAV